MNPNDIHIYRIVHWQNVEHILQNGICCSGHSSADPNYVNIGMRSLIAERHSYPIPIDGAGNLGEYVPFYFAGHSPMLYLIKRGYSGVEKRPQSDIVYFVCKFDTIKAHNLPFIFTDRNAKIAVANYFNDEVDFTKLDWTSIQARNWESNESNLQKRDKKQSEFLIKGIVPVSCIHKLVVKTIERKIYFEEMIRTLGLSIPVEIDAESKLYY